ncbi:MAG: signal peptidase I [FCB group bacterium]|jgi:signal peptidase I
MDITKDKPKNIKDKKKKKAQPQTFSQIIWSWTKTIVGAIIVVTILNGLAIASFVVPTGSMEKTVMTGDFLFVNKFIYGPTTPQVIPFFNIPLPFYHFPAFRQPEKGDVIVFIFPGNRDEIEPSEFQYYLKRCVATPGDTLEVRQKHLFVNGKEMALAPHGEYDESIPETPADKWQTFPYGRGYTRDNYGPIRIPKKGDIIQLNPQNVNEWMVFIGREGHNVTTTGSAVFIDGKEANTYKINRDYCFGMGDNRDHSLDSRYWGFIPVENVVGTPMIVYWSWDTALPLSKLIDKIASVRWSRIATIIR